MQKQIEDSWSAPARKLKPGNNKYNYRKPFKPDSTFKDVKTYLNTWTYKSSFIKKQVSNYIFDIKKKFLILLFIKF